MSNRYKGGIISATPPTTTGGESGTASGAWTLEQQMQLIAAGLWPLQPTPKYIEDVFSTYLYTGTNSTQSIVNGIDLSTKGGMCWFKIRDTGTYNHALVDTARGRAYTIGSDITNSQYTSSAGNDLSSFNTNGFTVGPVEQFSAYNRSGNTIVNWTFRKQPKFFDVVTYTGNGTNQTIAHNLGAVPGCIIVKRTDSATNWAVYHRSLGNDSVIFLNTTNAVFTGVSNWNSTTPTSTVFSVGSSSATNENAGTYVAYVFAHNAGGFGLTETDNVISCGSFTTDGSGNASVTLGYEPQFVMWKKSSAAGAWNMQDVMRGMPVTGDGQFLEANASDAEYGASQPIRPNATGFYGALTSNASSTYIYIAIRRGPMKVPTSGTSVFGVTLTENASAPYASSAFPVDFGLVGYTSGGGYYVADRLRGAQELVPSSTAAESGAASYKFDYQNGWLSGVFGANLFYTFKRAPSYFDEVCYTGTGSATTQTHNLQAVPELIIVKKRNVDSTTNWYVYSASLGNTQVGVLSGTNAFFTSSAYWNNTTPTSSVFSLGTGGNVNQSGTLFVSYLFATCAGVSKVGSYTGTGALQTVNCGFTGGARFVLIKRTDSTGDWYVYDSSRGLTSGNDPYFLMNSSAAQVTGTNYVDTDTTGFKVTAAAPADLNASGGTYIFLAIA